MQKILIDKAFKGRLGNLWQFMPILLPVLVAIIYYGLIASDRYVTSASFVIRGTDAPRIDMVSMMMGLGGGQSLEDSYIFREYMQSQDIIENIKKEIPLTEIFRRDGVDFISRMETNPTQESLQNYWKNMVDIKIDKSTALVSVSVRAFTPEDSLAVMQALLKAGESRLNGISKRSRQDAMLIAQDELADSVVKLNEIRTNISSFRKKHKMLDPAQTVVAQQGISNKLEEELVSKIAERANLKTYMQNSAPQVESLTKRIDSLRTIIGQETNKNLDTLMSEGKGEDQAIIDEYNQMLIDREVAEKTYLSATEFMTRARIDSLTQHKYISVFAEPLLPQEAVEPHRIKNIFIVFAFTLLFWGIGQLILATIKEHRQWNL